MGDILLSLGGGDVREPDRGGVLGQDAKSAVSSISPPSVSCRKHLPPPRVEKGVCVSRRWSSRNAEMHLATTHFTLGLECFSQLVSGRGWAGGGMCAVAVNNKSKIISNIA